jgi:hypothetical protein
MSEMLGDQNVVVDTRSMKNVVAPKGNAPFEREVERVAQARDTNAPSDVRGRSEKKGVRTRKLVGSRGNLVVAAMKIMKRPESGAVLREIGLPWKRDTQPLTQSDIASMTTARRKGDLHGSIVRGNTTRAAVSLHEFRERRLHDQLTKRWNERPDEQSVDDFTVNASLLLP